MALTDLELVAHARDGDGEALATLLERHAPVVRQRLGGAIPARWQSLLSIDDVMQEAFTDAFLAIGRFKPEGPDSFPAWLTTLARHNLLDAIKMLEADKRGGEARRAHAGPALGGADQSVLTLLDVIADSIGTPSRQVAGAEACLSLQQAVEQLPETYRLVVQQYDLEGCPIDEVASRLGRSEGAVYMLRSRAHRMLAERMGHASKFMTQKA